MNKKCTKRRYRTELDAKIALASTARKAATGRKQHDNRDECRTYRCPVCKGWHLTSQAVRV